MRLLRVLLLLPTFLMVAACGPTPKVVVIATVKTVDEGVNVFKTWAVTEEDHIASDAVAKCKDALSRSAYDSCVNGVVEPRRAPIDKVKAAMKVYLDVVSAAGGVVAGNVVEAARALTQAFADIGIKVGG